MRAIVVTATLAAALALPAAAAAQNREHQQMFADLRMLQEQVQQLRLAVNTLADAVKGINTKQDEQANATRKGFADQKVLTDQLTDSIRILREKGDDTNVRISTLSREVETLRQTVQALQTSVVQSMAQVPPAAPTGGAPAGATGDPSAPAGTQPAPPASIPPAKKIYEDAWSDHISGHYELAIKGFQAYLQWYPTSPDAYQAQLNIGESYFSWGRYQDAVNAYSSVINNYKGSPVESTAYYKRALSYEQLNMKDQARADLQYVIKTFPDSNDAVLAKQALERIK